MGDFIKLKTELLENPTLNANQKIILALLEDRLELSKKNPAIYQDTDGFFVHFTENELSKYIGATTRTARKEIKNLKEKGYIKTKKGGDGHPNKIYMADISEVQNFRVCQNSDRKNFPICSNSDRKNFPICSNSDRKNFPPIQTNIYNQTKYIKRNIKEKDETNALTDTLESGVRLAQPTTEPKAGAGEPEQTKTPKYQDEIKIVLEYFNSTVGTRYKTTRPNKAYAKEISGRLSDGFTLEDFKQVINTKNAKWHNDPKMYQYLNPSTLFRVSNFEKYLNEIATPAYMPQKTKFHNFTERTDENGEKRDLNAIGKLFIQNRSLSQIKQMG